MDKPAICLLWVSPWYSPWWQERPLFPFYLYLFHVWNIETLEHWAAIWSLSQPSHHNANPIITQPLIPALNPSTSLKISNTANTNFFKYKYKSDTNCFRYYLSSLNLPRCSKNHLSQSFTHKTGHDPSLKQWSRQVWSRYCPFMMFMKNQNWKFDYRLLKWVLSLVRVFK